MKNNIFSLHELPLNKTGIIVNLNCENSIKQRLLDLGLVPGTYITPLFTSPFDEPTAFEFRNTIVSIRKEDCLSIFVKSTN